MSTRALYVWFMAIALQLILLSPAQENAIKPDLSKIGNTELWSVHNREVDIKKEDNRLCVHLDAKPEDGVVWLKDINFVNGTIEADIKGKNLPGQSFVGIAFKGVDANTYDAVYFRPFNFKSDDPVRKGHGVQYISHPDYTWYKLRETYPEKYENPVNPVPDPDSFFHVKIVVEKPVIRVYVNDAKEDCLEVKEINDRKGGWIGFWTGNNSEGTFANLKIIPARQ